MEKVIATLRAAPGDDAWCTRLRTEVADDLLALGASGLAVNVRDAAVTDSLMTLTTLDPPVVAVVEIWTQQSYGPHVTGALSRLTGECARVDAYLVTESVPLPPPPTEPGARTPGFANIALLRRPADLDEETWLARWHLDHTPVAIATQSTFGYTQNTVVRPLTPGAPVVDAIVEELFPLEATRDLHAFFGAADDADLGDRMNRMVASTSAFGANRDVDTVPTSRYVLRSPFAAEVTR
ncbi:EthD domain-containing protein [Mycobacterium yunnanensis]|uniref:EthD domain-containing protein n=1 Tax=Mycobacterium yunnanensis TaxID=368477 RepID=A0A9X3BZX2_9MYCO|nr:EthD domain-containing protein [Mycobacterium yunnanensis]MCV7420173.1 EthD domain-containing protein [Mycobacterium yunnanensis]